MWTMERRGDVAVSWACELHFNEVALGMQRDHEITELMVRHSPKAKEWAEISRTLDAVANEGRNRHLCGGYYDAEKYCPTCHMPTIPKASSDT